MRFLPLIFILLLFSSNGLKKATGNYSWLPIKLSENLNYKSDNSIFLIPEDCNEIYLLNHVEICEGMMNFKTCTLH